MHFLEEEINKRIKGNLIKPACKKMYSCGNFTDPWLKLS